MRYATIKKFDIANGVGIGVALFVSGCKFHCYNCFNKEVQDYNYGNEYNNDTIIEIHAALNKQFISHLSLIGGDPMWQTPEDVEQLIKLCEYAHQIGKTVWLWTGFTYEEIFSETENPTPEQFARIRLFDHCDIVVDGRYVDEQRDLTLKWRGSKNQRVLDVKQCKLQNKPILLENEN